MNLHLALYFDDHALMAAVEPFDGKYLALGRGEPACFGLYFYLTDQGIEYGLGYQADVAKGDPRAIGDFYERLLDPDFTFQVQGYDRQAIDLLAPVISDVRRDYAAYFATQVEQPPQAQDRIPLQLAFSDNIAEAARAKIRTWLAEQGLELPEEETTFSEWFVAQQQRSRNLPAGPGTFGLVEAVNDTLNLTLVEVNAAGTIREVAHKHYPGMGADPRLGTIAKFVVDEINRARNLLHTTADREAEYRRQLPAATSWNQQLLSTRRPFIAIEACLTGHPNSPAHITLKKDDIDKLTRDRSLQVSRFFDALIEAQRLKPEALTGVVILGDSMQNDFVRDGFAKFGANRLRLLGSAQAADVLKGMLAPRHGGGPVDPTDPGKKPSGPIRIPDDLAPQDRIEFTWDPGRVVVASYLGQHKFVIISHQHSSIRTGDSFRVSGEIQPGKKAQFQDVTRVAKNLGPYQTGVITSVRKL